MKNFLLVLIFLAIVLGGVYFFSFQTAQEVAVKADQISGNMFAFKESVDEMHNKVRGIVAEGYSEPDEEIKDKKKQPEKKSLLKRLFNLFKR